MKGSDNHIARMTGLTARRVIIEGRTILAVRQAKAVEVGEKG